MGTQSDTIASCMPHASMMSAAAAAMAAAIIIIPSVVPSIVPSTMSRLRVNNGLMSGIAVYGQRMVRRRRLRVGYLGVVSGRHYEDLSWVVLSIPRE